MVWESLAAWYAWMDSNSRGIFAQGSWLYDPCASSLSRLRCLRIASSYHDISLPLACAWQQPSGLTNFTVATGICIPNLGLVCLLDMGIFSWHASVREIRACQWCRQRLCIVSMYQKPERDKSRDSRAPRLPCTDKWICSKFSSLTVGWWSCGCKA